MGVINDRHKCYLCKEDFDYHFRVPLGDTQAAAEGEEAETVVATGALLGSQGNITQCEVIVRCPHCGMMNKIQF